MYDLSLPPRPAISLRPLGRASPVLVKFMLSIKCTQRQGAARRRRRGLSDPQGQRMDLCSVLCLLEEFLQHPPSACLVSMQHCSTAAGWGPKERGCSPNVCPLRKEYLLEARTDEVQVQDALFDSCIGIQVQHTVKCIQQSKQNSRRCHFVSLLFVW